ncbi:rCG25067 [Rattus norvegicus]|uniref:RCG25067 n=1 Tax=Rattus norvegicus TaxID=10116 RepID=A6I208_RAT|nr:rCG25067 [Rattus norvegicus]
MQRSSRDHLTSPHWEGNSLPSRPRTIPVCGRARLCRDDSLEPSFQATVPRP